MGGDGASTQLRVSAFRGLQNLPLFVATWQGYFATQGLAIDILYTPGSAAQIAGLLQGEYELIQTAPDNVVSANGSLSSSTIDTDSFIVMLLGGSVGPLSIYGRPDVTSLTDLHGAVIGVDNPSSGFSLLLRDMLARDGLMLDRDYTFTFSGGTSARLDALAAGSVSATLLYAPYDLLAENAGFRQLAISPSYFAAYASSATAGLRGWVNQHAHVVTSYIAAILQALRWIYDATNADAVQALLQEEAMLGLDASIAALAYTAFITPGTGFGEDARLDGAGLAQVIALRETYGGPAQKLYNAMDYCDLRWYYQAKEAGA